MEYDKRAFVFVVRTSGYRAYNRFLEEIEALEPLTQNKFGIDGPTCSIVNRWARGSKDVYVTADSPVLEWARRTGKTIKVVKDARNAPTAPPGRYASRGKVQELIEAGAGVTLNGKRAKLSGFTLDFAQVHSMEDAQQAEWSWETALRVLTNGGAFSA